MRYNPLPFTSRSLFRPSFISEQIILLMLSKNFSNTQSSSRKNLPIKKNDADMLRRIDIQFDLLHYIFSDTNAVFTDQTQAHNQSMGASSSKVKDPPKKLTFAELYISSLNQSPKCSKVLKDKMKETPAFAVELAKISLLANVGRINTTMACA